MARSRFTEPKPQGAARLLLMLWIRYKLADARWALREIDPLHQDAPGLLVKCNALEHRWKELTS